MINSTTNDTLLNTQPPKWFTIISIIALAWNLMGVTAFISQMMMTPEMIAELPQVEQTLYNSVPLWATLAFAIAVFGGTFGSLALLMKKNIAKPLFIFSLLGVTVQMFHAFFISNALEVYGPGGAIMPTMVFIFSVSLLLLTSKAITRMWLH